MTLTKAIDLGNGKFAIVDAEDCDRISKFKWYCDDEYAVACEYLGVIDGKSKSKKIRMHRIIMDAKKGQIVDHINGNFSDNRKCNLRFATHQQNLQNQKQFRKRKNMTSQYKGVSWCSQYGKWKAGIRVNKKLIYLGHHAIEINAAKTYNEAAEKYFGEFACLNEVTQ